MSTFSVKVLAGVTVGAAMLFSAAAQAITVHHHVITQTSTGMIDTIYDTATHVYAVNTFTNAISAPVVIAANTTYIAASDGLSNGAWSVDHNSYPASIPVQTDSGGNIVNSDNIIGAPLAPPGVPVPGYSGPVIRTYISYGQNGAPKNTLYVQFWYSDGTLDGITVQTAPPPGFGGGGGCGGSGQRPCPDPQ
jgi:hypothetical protein